MTTFRPLRWLGILSLIGTLSVPALAAPPARCDAPPDLMRLTRPLPRIAARLAAREPVLVVALGSSSTAGAGATSPAATYPSRLQALLGERFPGGQVHVLNKGVGGEDAATMLGRFDRDVLAHRPDLVIWQVGTNALLHNEGLDQYGQTIRRGVLSLQGAGIDVIIMDLQYSPRILAKPGYEDMLDRLEQVAGEMRVPVFRRFDIMQHWIESGQFSFADMLSPDRLHMNDASYDCIARLLAAAIAEAGAGRHAQADSGP